MDIVKNTTKIQNMIKKSVTTYTHTAKNIIAHIIIIKIFLLTQFLGVRYFG